MNERTITWEKDHPEAQYSSISGTDQDGNKFWMNACQEVCQCELKDGRKGQGWTPAEAYASAQAKADPLAAERAKVKRLRDTIEWIAKQDPFAAAGTLPTRAEIISHARAALKETE